MKFICEIGNCKRNKKPSEFETFKELMAHINLPKWQHALDAKKLQGESNAKARNSSHDHNQGSLG